MSEDIGVYENLSDNAITFDTKEEFMIYYQDHKDEIDSKPTRGLNMKYVIDGYKIGRKNGRIMLYPTRDDDDDDRPVKQAPAPQPKRRERSPSPQYREKNRKKKYYYEEEDDEDSEEEYIPKRRSMPPPQKRQPDQSKVDAKLNNLNERLKKVEQLVNQIVDFIKENS